MLVFYCHSTSYFTIVICTPPSSLGGRLYWLLRIDVYEAPAPCSEPEAAALLAVARGFKPHVWMNAHSGMEALFMPYDHLPRIPDGDAARATLQVVAGAPPTP